MKLQNLLPFTNWLFRYERKNLGGDITAGLIVTVMLIPQSLAYAMLAGLPPNTACTPASCPCSFTACWVAAAY
ncbi:MAG: SulP family inorganic anion transporter [Planctomycetota bacterium]|nr:SulP family inorganic anion transporter [Planctomycetota bacterium]